MKDPHKTCRAMIFWHELLDSLDTDGGTRAIAIFLILLGMFGSRTGVPKAEDIIVGSFGFLLGFMKSTGSNKDRREGPPMPLPTNAGAAPVMAPNPIPSSAPIVEAVESVAEAINDQKAPLT